MNQCRKGLLRIGSMLFVLIVAFFAPAACTTSEKTPEHRDAAHNESKHEERDGAVRLTPDAVRMAGIEVQHVAAAPLAESISATAVLELNGDRTARINPRVSGRVVFVKASLGDRVRSGQTLAGIDSGEVDQAWTETLKAKARLELATRNVKREETLFAKKVSPEKDLFKARQELREVEADMLMAREKLRLLGIDAKRVEASANSAKHEHPLIPVSAPLSGAVVEKFITGGEMVGPEKTIFTIADLSSLWLMIDIHERDIGRVRKGMQIKLSVSSRPGKEFRGRISYIGDIMDEKSRTVKARVTIDNREGLLKPGMFASASIFADNGAAVRKVIAVPEEAVFLNGSERLVFLQTAEGRFETREILPGPAADGRIEIKEGLKEGDAVVVKGIFALKSELKKQMLEVHEH